MCYRIEKANLRGWYWIHRQTVRGDNWVRLPYMFSQEAAVRLTRMADVQDRYNPKRPTYDWWKRAVKVLGPGVMND